MEVKELNNDIQSETAIKEEEQCLEEINTEALGTNDTENFEELQRSDEQSCITDNADAKEGGEASPADIYNYLGDLEELAEKFPEMRAECDLTSLKNPLRYAALRDLGLSTEEAYLATSGKAGVVRDNRTHLGGSVPRGAAVPRSAMSARELREAREIFGNIGDGELIRLYRKVTSNL